MTENLRSATARLSCAIVRVLVATTVCLSPWGAVFAQQQAPSGDQAPPAAKTSGAEDGLNYETLTVRQEGAVLFVEIAAPPMNRLGPKLVGEPSIGLLFRQIARPSARPVPGLVAVKERVNAIALAPAEAFRRDSDLFGEGVRKPEAQSRLQAALKCGFQTRDA